MKINREEFGRCLTKIKSVFAKKSILIGRDICHFTGTEIFAYNENMYISVPIKTDFSCSVEINELGKIIFGLACSEIDISLKNNKLAIAGEKIKAAITIEQESAVPQFNRQDIIKKAKVLPSNFIDALQLCLLSASKNIQDGILSNVLIEDDIIASSDNFRISEYILTEKIDCSILLPVFTAIEIIKFDVKKYHIEDINSIYFFSEDTIILAKLSLGVFPAYEKILNKINTKNKIVFPAEFKENIDLSSIFIQDDSARIKVEIKNEKMICSSQNDAGSIAIEIEMADKKKEQISFLINPLFMKEILKYKADIYLDEGVILFQDKDFRHLITLEIE